MKKLSIILVLMVATLFAQAQTIQQTYHFGQPTVSERDGYQQIGLQGCLPYGTVGEPTLPWQSVSLILPQGQEAVSINMEFADFVELEGSFNLYPYQQPRPISSEKEIPFAKKESLYRSEKSYPTTCYGRVNTQYLNGVAVAISGFTPLRYVPATGKVSYARTVTVTIETTMSRDDHSRKLWLTPENEASLQRLAQNANLLNTYSKRGRDIGGYDMLVITKAEWIEHFGEYLNLYNDKGIRTRIVALEDIYASMEGCDEQEQIRNYIIQEYEDNGIQMVSLGGDVSIVPYRSLYCWAQEGYEDQLPSDMYYACLDGTLNDDNDDRWGEVDEDDLLPEIGIGRLPFNNETQFNNIMNKTLSYLQTPVLGEFTSPILGAEHLGDGYFGSDDLERLIGENNDFDYTTYCYPEDYTFKRYYASPTKTWSGGDFKRVIGTGGQYVHHVGHANSDFVAGWEGSSVNNSFFSANDGVTHNYMLFHSHGCICGNFPAGCILEKMVTVPNGFVVTTGNSRYGWYVPWGDGMAAHIHREFVDAYCHDHIATVGMALREAKIASAPWVEIPYIDENGEPTGEENGCLRWNLYCLNVLGDAAIYPWFEEPFTPNVVFEQGLKTGTTTTTVHVSHFDAPLDNFRVSLFDGETLLGFGITDENGDAELTFSPALDVIGEMHLVVTGQSAWPQNFDVMGFDSNEAYIYGDIIGLDGIPEFNTNRYVNIDLHNVGDQAAFGVEAQISTDCEYVSVYPSNLLVANLAANSTMNFEQGAYINIADNVPDQTILTLNLTTTTGDVAHTTSRQFLLLAPNLQFGDLEIIEVQGDQNGYFDPGEQVIMRIHGKNIGHATAPNTYVTVYCDDERLSFADNTVQVGNVDSDGDFTADFIITSDPDIVNGTIFNLDMTLNTGSYATQMDYSTSIGLVKETFESADFSYMEWFHEGDLPWTVTDEEAHTGTYSARSGAIGDNEVTRLIIYADILNDGEISFWFKTSTELRKDLFAFFLDNKKKDMWSGENDWTYVSYEFTAGSHSFMWLYDKNGNNAVGSDCVWIDDITFPRTCIITNVEEVTEQKATVLYPNPTTGSFTLELIEESNISIYNMLGQQIMQLGKVSGIHHLDLGNAPKGMYCIQIQNGSQTEVKKLIVE
ncbi:MAG: T9SS type A sorting domain-containing protein [Bacteroidales bacterium]|nr:T9SS type A sorting domain-containing protein [Bacteroidales bacterium]